MSENNVVVKPQDEISICAEDGYVLLTQKDAYGEEQTVWFNFEYADAVTAAILRLHRQTKAGS